MFWHESLNGRGQASCNAKLMKAGCLRSSHVLFTAVPSIPETVQGTPWVPNTHLLKEEMSQNDLMLLPWAQGQCLPNLHLRQEETRWFPE